MATGSYISGGSGCISTAHSGKFGAVACDGVRLYRVTSWNLRIRATGVRFVSTGVAMWTQFLPSVRTATGSINWILDVSKQQHTILQTSECCTLLLDPSFNGPSQYLLKDAVVLESNVQCNVLTGAPVSGSFTFESGGAVLMPGEFGETEFPSLGIPTDSSPSDKIP